MNIGIIGLGYVGLVTSVCLAEMGNKVICLDKDKNKIKLLEKGISPIYEYKLEELIRKNKESLLYTSNKNQFYEKVDTIFVCVGTPEKSDGSVDLSCIFEVANDIANNIKKDAIIIIKSTVPVGTGEKIENHIKRNLKVNIEIEVVSNPEFLSQGNAIKNFLEPQRVIVGVASKKAKIVMEKIYNKDKSKIIITDRKTAEIIKYACNNFLALKISYINEIANLCELIGANIEEVQRAMGLDDRIGKKF